MGLFLFLLYINPLVERIRRVNHIDSILYGGDITLVAVGPTAAVCAATVQKAIGQVQSWCDENCMPLAPTKTKAILLTPSSNSDETNPGLRVGTVRFPLEKVFAPGCKLLGIHLDSHLSFNGHIAEVRSRACLNLLLLLRHAITHMGPSTMTEDIRESAGGVAPLLCSGWLGCHDLPIRTLSPGDLPTGHGQGGHRHRHSGTPSRHPTGSRPGPRLRRHPDTEGSLDRTVETPAPK